MVCSGGAPFRSLRWRWERVAKGPSILLHLSVFMDTVPWSWAQNAGRAVILQPVWLQQGYVKGSFSWECNGWELLCIVVYTLCILGGRVWPELCHLDLCFLNVPLNQHRTRQKPLSEVVRTTKQGHMLVTGRRCRWAAWMFKLLRKSQRMHVLACSRHLC